MNYDFTTVANAANPTSAKWQLMRRHNRDLPGNIVPFSVADMEFVHPPEFKEALKGFIDEAVFGYSIIWPEFYQSIIDWIGRRHAWSIEKEWIIPLDGVVPELFTAVTALSAPGDGVIIMTPVYYPFYDAVKETGRKLVDCPLVDQGGYKIDFEALEKLAEPKENTLLILCNPHNPVGRVWTREELLKVLAIAEKHNLAIVSDDIHFDIIMPCHTHTMLGSLSSQAAARTVTLAAPSKTFNLAGMKCAYMIVPNPEFRQKIQQILKGQHRMATSVLGLKSCELAYGLCEPWLEAVLKVIEANRAYVTDYLRVHLPWVNVYPMEGTYLLWMDFRGCGLDPKALEAKMTQEALLFMDEGYIFGEGGAGFERMNLAVPQWVLEEAMVRLVQIFGVYNT